MRVEDYNAIASGLKPIERPGMNWQRLQQSHVVYRLLPDHRNEFEPCRDSVAAPRNQVGEVAKLVATGNYDRACGIAGVAAIALKFEAPAAEKDNPVPSEAKAAAVRIVSDCQRRRQPKSSGLRPSGGANSALAYSLSS